MKRLFIVLAGLAVCSAAHAGSPVTINNAANTVSAPVDSSGLHVVVSGGTPPAPATITTTDRGGTLTSGGVAQNAIASNASRKTWCIQNDPAATETLYVRSNGTASATTGVALVAGAQACNQPGTVDTSAVSVYAATTSHRWFGSEAQ
jgi:hypothetical protein